ncbi:MULTISPECIES: histidinol-phosphate transaminase [unclassified Janthinobacterium]|uniref:histidinol-phosphate transaminase n=1 Tax=unclassified Janthinobacterium TaxID=2610881 RepID=UPI00161F3323|nr:MULTISPECIES: histidinol-phosphate transaminase [unclassified Janthinobacterium]MBB5608213.1 histidinol-phosphate aminotransferase [Janthinobacterium sp. S3T4]MBB5613539.1 histidinol-phosphate aminotransferase [Janthinobacterium sp. S3M3]
MSFLDQLISNTVRSDVQDVKSYHVPDASGYIKLDAMENPYLLPQHLRDELGLRLAGAVLNRYPPSYASLKAAICSKLGVPAGYDVLLGNGSDELISILAMACAVQAPLQQRPRRAVLLAPVPGFVMYARSAQFAGMDFVGVPLLADLSLDIDAMLAAIEQHRPALVFLAYPNNPTGNLFSVADIERIIAALGDTGIAVVDEAYEPFAQQSFMGRLPEFENLVVMRTVSKLGLAGIRLGYMSAAPALLAQFEKVRPPYNVNVLTQVAAEFALEHVDVLNAQAALLNSARDALAEQLAALPGVTVFPSKANFLLIRVPDSDDVYAKLLTHRVLIKNVSKMHAVLANCLRISVSTPEDNAIFFNAFKASLV